MAADSAKMIDMNMSDMRGAMVAESAKKDYEAEAY
jgi:hypothetical protein